MDQGRLQTSELYGAGQVIDRSEKLADVTYSLHFNCVLEVNKLIERITGSIWFKGNYGMLTSMVFPRERTGYYTLITKNDLALDFIENPEEKSEQVERCNIIGQSNLRSLTPEELELQKTYIAEKYKGKEGVEKRKQKLIELVDEYYVGLELFLGAVLFMAIVTLIAFIISKVSK